MLFTAPIWLLALLPWGIAAVVLLMSRRPKTDVPFLELWQLNAPQESIRRSFSTPPVGVILALIAALTAIVAAAGPAWTRGGAHVVTVVVDTGASMSMRSADGRRRYATAADQLTQALRNAGHGDVQLKIVTVPTWRDAGLSTASAGNVVDRVAALPPSAIETGSAVGQAAHQVMRSGGPVFVLTDSPTDLPPGVVHVPPPAPADNLAIRQFAVRRSPYPQAMVVIARGPAAGGPRSVAVRITGGGQSVTQVVELLPAESKSVFVSLSSVAAVVTAELLEATPGGVPLRDAFDADNRAYLVAETDWASAVLSVNIAELQRFVDAYRRSRPVGERSPSVRLVATPAEAGTSPAVILSALGGTLSATRVTTVADHPVVGGVNWAAFDLPAAVDRTLPPGAWQTLLSDAAGPLLAVRELSDPLNPAVTRQAWCAIDPRGWSANVGYVVFHASLLDWIGGERIIAFPLHELTGDWSPIERSPGGEGATYWPGVYERADGARRAFGPASAIAAPTIEATPDGLRQAVASAIEATASKVSVTPGLLVIALALAGSGAAVWRRRVRTSAKSMMVAPPGASPLGRDPMHADPQ